MLKELIVIRDVSTEKVNKCRLGINQTKPDIKKTYLKGVSLHITSKKTLQKHKPSVLTAFL